MKSLMESGPVEKLLHIIKYLPDSCYAEICRTNPCKYSMAGKTGRKEGTMVSNYFSDPRRLRRFQNGILAPHMDAFAESFSEKGYTQWVIREYLRDAHHFADYAAWLGKTKVGQLDHALAEDFLNNHLPNCSCERMNSGKFANATAAMDHLMKFLVANQFIDEAKPKAPDMPKPISDILVKYDEYLLRRKGLSVKTRGIHRVKASAFIDWLKDRHGCVDLSALDNDDILDYQKHVDSYGFSLDYKKTVTNCLRGFLRFLRWERVLDKDLTPAVFRVIEWSLSSLPRYMPFEDVKILLQAPDRDTPEGKRDIAMLILMAYLGLRANEVINLHISDIDFVSGEILIRKTKTFRARKVPLTIEIAEILIDYINNGRGNVNFDKLFIRTIAPHTPLIAPAAPGIMVRKYLKEAGLQVPKKGTHLLRHSLATHLINNGSTLKEIADLLGHKNIQSTTIYAKVQVERLKDVALPFPAIGGVSL